MVAIGPDSVQRQKFRYVLERMAVGGKDELHFLDDFANSKEATNAITKSLCREYLNKRRVNHRSITSLQVIKSPIWHTPNHGPITCDVVLISFAMSLK